MRLNEQMKRELDAGHIINTENVCPACFSWKARKKTRCFRCYLESRYVRRPDAHR